MKTQKMKIMESIDSSLSIDGTENEEQDSLIADKKLPLVSSCYIYRVPPKLRKVNEDAYTPALVSIGPFHHRDERLESTKELKLQYLHKFMERTHENSVEYIEKLRAWEGKIRCCYSETIAMESDEFVNMILTDACFIIEFFLEFKHPLDKDPLAAKPWRRWYIMLDLILLENQLPFFVLEGLFKLAFPSGFGFKRLSFVKLAYKNFRTSELLCYAGAKKARLHLTFEHFEQQYLTCSEVYHLNDILRMFYLPHKLKKGEQSQSPPVKLICSASQLREAGIKFKAKNHHGMADVHYDDGELKIPCFTITDWTETMIRNVIAFEQCHHPYESYVTDNIVFWDHLIDTEKDVELLVQKKIIKNFLSDNNAVAFMVNGLCRNFVPISSNHDYVKLCEDLNDFYDKRTNKYKAIFRHEYLRTPWKIASLVAAILLLFLTLIQAVCSVIALFQK
ncbi:UPF0481 protein At3g47200-like [Prosopis cineraria]|uniref:UPF0481 protein At3g47200-like n=1 Tax=Prosopis cineraria TaxID=364024 RepID=UPI00240EA0C6|nr:UPF0481 protein At3g47200-like [Prosopis cineraria]